MRAIFFIEVAAGDPHRSERASPAEIAGTAAPERTARDWEMLPSVPQSAPEALRLCHPKSKVGHRTPQQADIWSRAGDRTNSACNWIAPRRDWISRSGRIYRSTEQKSVIDKARAVFRLRPLDRRARKIARGRFVNFPSQL